MRKSEEDGGTGWSSLFRLLGRHAPDPEREQRALVRAIGEDRALVMAAGMEQDVGPQCLHALP